MATKKLRPSLFSPSLKVHDLRLAYNERDASNPHVPSRHCKFQHFVYNLVEPALQDKYECPPYVDPKRWRKAQQDRPRDDACVPAPVVGYDALRQRVHHDQQVARELGAYVDKVESSVAGVDAWTARTELAMERARHRQLQLGQRLLAAMHKVDLLLAWGLPFHERERELRDRLQQLGHEIPAPQRQLAELATHFAHEGRHFETLARLGDADMGALHRALASQNEGLEHLTKILQRDERDLEIVLREAMNDVDPSRAA